jgi:transposase InsO family protein
LLAMKDQALEAWCTIKNHWENHLEWKVKVFQSDNGGEFVNSAFTKALQDSGIEHQLSAPYTHQQNGKAKRVMHTIEGHLFIAKVWPNVYFAL